MSTLPLKIVQLVTAISAANTSAFDRNITVGKLPPKEPKKCLLPKCLKLASHNGGYCCAEHCKLHRTLIQRQIS